MRCPYCKQKIHRDFFEHIRTECEGPKKKEKKPKKVKRGQMKLWPGGE